MTNQQLLNQYKAHTGTTANGDHYKLIGSNMCDVFRGEGFSTPTRYRLIKGAWVYVTGPKLTGPVTLP